MSGHPSNQLSGDTFTFQQDSALHLTAPETEAMWHQQDLVKWTLTTIQPGVNPAAYKTWDVVKQRVYKKKNWWSRKRLKQTWYDFEHVVVDAATDPCYDCTRSCACTGGGKYFKHMLRNERLFTWFMLTQFNAFNGYFVDNIKSYICVHMRF